jgi:hypothetical protein
VYPALSSTTAGGLEFGSGPPLLALDLLDLGRLVDLAELLGLGRPPCGRSAPVPVVEAGLRLLLLPLLLRRGYSSCL